MAACAAHPARRAGATAVGGAVGCRGQPGLSRGLPEGPEIAVRGERLVLRLREQLREGGVDRGALHRIPVDDAVAPGERIDVGIGLVGEARELVDDARLDREDHPRLSALVIGVERESVDGALELLAGHEHDPRVVAEPIAERLLDAALQRRLGFALRRREAHVPAREHGAHVGESEFVEQGAELGRLDRDPADVHPAEQGDELGHDATLPRAADTARHPATLTGWRGRRRRDTARASPARTSASGGASRATGSEPAGSP